MTDFTHLINIRKGDLTMNEFLKPDRHENPQPSAAVYEVPESDIQIKVGEIENTDRYCSKCGAPLDANDSFCGRCGSRIYGAPSHTSAAGSVNTEQAPATYNYTYNYNYNNSSSNINSYTSVQPGIMKGMGQKDKYVSLVLCLLFGWCGVHRFYEGKIASGILYAISGGLGGIGWLIDLIILIFKPRFYDP